MKAIHVGLPEGLAYTYDLDRMAWVQVWRGPFLDATPMLYRRGDASVVPQGLQQQLGDAAGLAPADATTAWPDSLATAKFLGYRLDGQGLPAFRYQLAGTEVHDQVVALGTEGFRREIRPQAAPDQPLSCRLTTARQVEILEKGLIRVDGSYYLRFDPQLDLQQQAEGDFLQLVAPLTEGGLSYEVIW